MADQKKDLERLECQEDEVGGGSTEGVQALEAMGSGGGVHGEGASALAALEDVSKFRAEIAFLVRELDLTEAQAQQEIRRDSKAPLAAIVQRVMDS